MTQANKMGSNRTGMDTSPIDGEAMVEGAESLTDTAPPPQERVADFRKLAIDESGAVGSIPVPGTLKGALGLGKEKLQGHGPEVLVNKLGQRLAFERAGTRLYDAMIKKCEAGMNNATAKVVSVDTLKKFRDEEWEHMLLVKSVMTELGLDATAMTPDADIGAVAAMGLPMVVSEPRTTILQCLEAIQIAELTDNAAWADLKELCLGMGLRDIADRFSKPIDQEKVHEDVVADWIRQLLLHEGAG